MSNADQERFSAPDPRDRFSHWTQMIDSEIDAVSKMLFGYWQLAVLRKLVKGPWTFSPCCNKSTRSLGSIRWKRFLAQVNINSLSSSPERIRSDLARYQQQLHWTMLWVLEHRNVRMIAMDSVIAIACSIGCRMDSWPSRCGIVIHLSRLEHQISLKESNLHSQSKKLKQQILDRKRWKNE
jgi:hypothetical protein